MGGHTSFFENFKILKRREVLNRFFLHHLLRSFIADLYGSDHAYGQHKRITRSWESLGRMASPLSDTLVADVRICGGSSERSQMGIVYYEN